MKIYRYIPKGVCSRQIDLELEGNVIRSVTFLGGCHGNLQGLSKLLQGMTAEDAVSKLKGIRCGNKATSCPDQLSHALELALQQEQVLQEQA